MLKRLFKWYIAKYGDWNRHNWKNDDTLVVLEDAVILGLCKEATMLIRELMDKHEQPYTLLNVHRASIWLFGDRAHRCERNQLQKLRAGLYGMRPSKHVLMKPNGRITLVFGAFSLEQRKDGVIALMHFCNELANIQFAWEKEYLQVHIPFIWHFDLSRNGVRLWTYGGGIATRWHIDDQCKKQPWDKPASPGR